jgi:hypothetical protein
MKTGPPDLQGGSELLFVKVKLSFPISPGDPQGALRGPVWVPGPQFGTGGIIQISEEELQENWAEP